MLSPAQVIPFLQHDDPEVRRHAFEYLIQAHDPAPATCDDLWAYYDHFPITETPGRLRGLAALPQTESSYQRLMSAVRTEQNGGMLASFQEVLEELDYGLLAAHRDEVLACEHIKPDIRDHLRERLDLSHVPIDQLWDRLMRHGREVSDKHVGEFDMRISWRLIQALSPHTQFAGERALGILRDTSIEDWREIFAVDLLGLTKFRPAIDALIEKFNVDADVLRESVTDALVRFGDVEVIRKLEAFVPGKRWDVRLFALAPFERIKRPQSEAALLGLMPGEESRDLLTDMGAGLCMLCTTGDGAEAVRKLIVDGRYDPQMAELPEMLLTVGQMTGYAPPEAAQWRQEIADEAARRASMFPDTASLMENIGGFLGSQTPSAFTGEIRVGPEPAFVPPPRQGVPRPQHRAIPGAVKLPARVGPKVGRNDPCPCGSGKKYKKCHGQ